MSNNLTCMTFIFCLLLCGFQKGDYDMQKMLPDFKIEYNKNSAVDTQPRIFASGITNEVYIARDFILPSEDEIYFTIVKRDYSYGAIYHTRYVDNAWTEPEVAPFSADTNYKYYEPFISPNGKQFFFVSNMPVDGIEKAEFDFDIWVMDKTDEGWSDPKNIGAPINTKCLEAFPSVTKNGTLYFVRNDEAMTRSDVYRSRFAVGKYCEPLKLPDVINGEGDDNAFNACIALDESCIIFCSYREDGNFGFSDYYISFRDENDNWSKAVNMGEKFNSNGYEISPHFSFDGKYIIYSRGENIYWVTDGVIEEFRSK